MKNRIFITTIILSSVLSFSFICSAKTIPIETNNVGYYLVVDSENKVFQLHFGEKLSDIDEIDKIFFKTYSSINLRGNDAYSFFGNGNVNELALELIHSDGNMTSDLRYVSSSKERISNDIDLTTITLKDKNYPLQISLKYKAYLSLNIIETWVEIFHTETKPIQILKASSNLLCIESSSYYLTQFSGEWGDEMRISEEKLTRGIKAIETKRGVRTTQTENPVFILSKTGEMKENSGEVILGALSWSGNFRLSFQVDQFNKLSIITGVNDFCSEYSLSPKQCFKTPSLILAYSSNGTSQASRNFHSFSRNYILRNGNDIRPVILNSWEGAYFSFDEKVLTDMMDGAAELGVELFVVDDGWFGNKYPRNNDKMGLGDWSVNKQKLPNGLKYLIEYAKSKKMKFGIWIEPEMINPESELAKKHPDWIVGASSGRDPILLRNQQVLDLSNPKVQEHVFNTFDNLLTENPEISYIKWDANSHIQNFGSMYLGNDKQSNFFIDYVNGLYNVYGRLTTKYPNVMVQACSSGGGRADFGSLRYHHEIWPSDNTDALSREFIQWGYNYFFPSVSLAAHVSKTPNHQTKRIIPLKMRVDMAMTGRMGVELQPKDLDSTELSYLKSAITKYKKDVREIVQLGDYYRLSSPYQSGRSAQMYVSRNKSKAYVFAFDHSFNYRFDTFHFKLNGLDPEKKYFIKEINVENSGASTQAINGKTFSGDLLMTYGLHIQLQYEGESVVFELTEDI